MRTPCCSPGVEQGICAGKAGGLAAGQLWGRVDRSPLREDGLTEESRVWELPADICAQEITHTGVFPLHRGGDAC